MQVVHKPASTALGGLLLWPVLALGQVVAPAPDIQSQPVEGVVEDEVRSATDARALRAFRRSPFRARFRDDSSAPPATVGQNLSDRIAQADQIVRGTVVDITYAQSEDTGPDTVVLPHTFVTFRVDDPIKGGHTDQGITLRFVGGPTDDGLMMAASHVPLFNLDNEAVLFIKDNGNSPCPLVDCDNSLVRIVNEQVYDNDGVELFMDPRGTLRTGRQQSLPEVSVFQIGESEFHTNSSAQANQDDAIDSDGTMAAGQFVTWLKQEVARAHRPATLKSLPAEHSVDPAEPFVIEAPQWADPEPTQEASSNAAQSAVAAAMAESLDDQAEREALEANGDNPVLPVQ